jgi:hypothetical protein
MQVAQAWHPYAVFIRVPPVPGIGERLRQLHDAASATGPFTATSGSVRMVDFIRYGFTSEEHAELFRSRARAMVGDFVEHEDPWSC